jgi:anti-sigma regulatory factor (Ser/Thr protein kinase)
MAQWSVDMPGTSAMVPLIRRWVREVLAVSPLADRVELVVSELATNAVRHSASGADGGTLRVEITETPTDVTASVYDDGPRSGPANDWTADDAADFGRGLKIVNALSSAWGEEKPEEGGHRTWAVVQPPVEGDDGGEL